MRYESFGDALEASTGKRLSEFEPRREIARARVSRKSKQKMSILDKYGKKKVSFKVKLPRLQRVTKRVRSRYHGI